MLQQTTNQLHTGPPTRSLQQDWEAGVTAHILQRAAVRKMKPLVKDPMLCTLQRKSFEFCSLIQTSSQTKLHLSHVQLKRITEDTFQVNSLSVYNTREWSSSTEVTAKVTSLARDKLRSRETKPQFLVSSAASWGAGRGRCRGPGVPGRSLAAVLSTATRAPSAASRVRNCACRPLLRAPACPPRRATRHVDCRGPRARGRIPLPEPAVPRTSREAFQLSLPQELFADLARSSSGGGRGFSKQLRGSRHRS
ncbi:small integral membrane protein 3 isoform 1-T1 [Dama dama]|uniref:small integral membrane protein 3 isoform X1 n=1 Tax=Dama dama TaxID=30532 RepID=UPI002A362D0A|nr:small integral membrane protein 3 isoform X1 [Dama dama]